MANTLSHMLGQANQNDPNIIPITNETEVTMHSNVIEIKTSGKTVLLNPTHYKRTLMIRHKPASRQGSSVSQAERRLEVQTDEQDEPEHKDTELISVFFSDNYEHRFSGSKEFIEQLLSVFRNAEKFNPTAEHRRFKFKIGEEIKSPEPLGHHCEFAVKEIVRIELENAMFNVVSEPKVIIHVRQTVQGANKHVAFVAPKFITPNLIFHWTRSW
jgi:hypothetical protein